MLSKLASVTQGTSGQASVGAAIAWVVAWLWAIVAGGGGLWLLWTRGPWPLTNGWFALFSGVSACPATSWIFRKYAGVTISGPVRFAAATFFFVAGRIALAVGS
jgi:hypothetical protein